MVRFFNILLGLALGGIVMPLSSVLCTIMLVFKWSSLKNNLENCVTFEQLLMLMCINIVGVFSNFLSFEIAIGFVVAGGAALIFAFFTKMLLNSLIIISSVFIISMHTWWPVSIFADYSPLILQANVFVWVCYLYFKTNSPKHVKNV
ncbi:MAG: hypothetical protein CL578_05965 [Alteromonadaceae bacterium]|nr:hypothetical protein [Alteromonadaceae bacterium]